MWYVCRVHTSVQECMSVVPTQGCVHNYIYIPLVLPEFFSFHISRSGGEPLVSYSKRRSRARVRRRERGSRAALRRRTAGRRRRTKTAKRSKRKPSPREGASDLAAVVRLPPAYVAPTGSSPSLRRSW